MTKEQHAALVARIRDLDSRIAAARARGNVKHASKLLAERFRADDRLIGRMVAAGMYI